jgi:tRNA A22 N-methylase
VRKLGERLQAVADFAIGFDIVIDIGTDHGYLPIYLLTNKMVKHAIATDIMSGPLLQAKKNLDRYGLSDKINLVQCDGIPEFYFKNQDTHSLGLDIEVQAATSLDLQLGNQEGASFDFGSMDLQAGNQEGASSDFGLVGLQSGNLVQFGSESLQSGNQEGASSDFGSMGLQSGNLVQFDSVAKNDELHFENQDANTSDSDSENLVQFGLESLQSGNQEGASSDFGSMGLQLGNLVQSGSVAKNEENKIAITISGLGGETVLSIIRPISGVTYVLQPQSKQELFVSQLATRGYEIQDRKTVTEKSHTYFIYKVIYVGA